MFHRSLDVLVTRQSDPEWVVAPRCHFVVPLVQLRGEFPLERITDLRVARSLSPSRNGGGGAGYSDER